MSKKKENVAKTNFLVTLSLVIVGIVAISGPIQYEKYENEEVSNYAVSQYYEKDDNSLTIRIFHFLSETYEYSLDTLIVSDFDSNVLTGKEIDSGIVFSNIEKDKVLHVHFSIYGKSYYKKIKNNRRYLIQMMDMVESNSEEARAKREQQTRNTEIIKRIDKVASRRILWKKEYIEPWW